MKTQFILNAQTQFLRDTVQFYNSGNRCVGEHPGGCQYHPTLSSPGCAIGRHQPNKVLCQQWTNHPYKKTIGVGLGFVASIADTFPGTLGALEVLGLDFLAEVQKLHDIPHWWTKDGPSMDGRSYVWAICNDFGLPVEQVLLDC